MKRLRLRSPKDPARRRKVEEAIRYAEQVVKSSGQTGSVLFRPAQPADYRSKGSTGSKSPAPQVRPVNPTMELAIRQALNLPEKRAQPPAMPRPTVTVAKNVTNPVAQRKNVNPTIDRFIIKDPAFASPKPAKQPKKPKPDKTTKVAKKSALKGIKSRRKAKPPKVVHVREVTVPAVDRRLGVAQNEAARREFNARQRAAAISDASQPVSPFMVLQRRWHAAFAYLSRVQKDNPDAPGVIAAQHCLAEVEAEWERRQEFALDHPDYFPWPSTDAPGGSGSVIIGDWQEIGMLAYLGYHVGKSSSLSAAKRAQLLKHIYSMKLPPLNGITYMRDWGAPNTGVRLRKIAEGLAAFARNAKYRKNANFSTAIEHWESDLSYLKRNFYAGHYDFPWPTL